MSNFLYLFIFLFIFLSIHSVNAYPYSFSELRKTDHESISECLNIDPEILRVSCYAEFALQQNDVSYCFKGKTQSGYFESHCVFEVALKNKDVSICNTINKENLPQSSNRDLWKNNCIAGIAINIDNPFLCELIQEKQEDVKPQCYSGIAQRVVRVVNETGSNNTLCKNLPPAEEQLSPYAKENYHRLLLFGFLIPEFRSIQHWTIRGGNTLHASREKCFFESGLNIAKLSKNDSVFLAKNIFALAILLVVVLINIFVFLRGLRAKNFKWASLVVLLPFVWGLIAFLLYNAGFFMEVNFFYTGFFGVIPFLLFSIISYFLFRGFLSWKDNSTSWRSFMYVPLLIFLLINVGVLIRTGGYLISPTLLIVSSLFYILPTLYVLLRAYFINPRSWYFGLSLVFLIFPIIFLIGGIYFLTNPPSFH